jgi:hypothetical protein
MAAPRAAARRADSWQRICTVLATPMTDATRPPERRDIVTLADLAPRREVTGGTARRVFGSEPLLSPDDSSRIPPVEHHSDISGPGERPR